jgi:hypothetical protein
LGDKNQRASRSFKRRRKKSMKKGDQNEIFRGGFTWFLLMLLHWKYKRTSLTED